MSGIDAKAAFDSAWRAALDRQSAGRSGDPLSAAFDSATQRFEQQFEAAASGSTERIGGRGDLPGIDASQTGRPQVEALDGNASDAIRSVDDELKSADSITEDLLAGRIDSPHEVAARVRRADLTLRYSLEIRNRLVDAYREVMRMSV